MSTGERALARVIGPKRSFLAKFISLPSDSAASGVRGVERGGIGNIVIEWSRLAGVARRRSIKSRVCDAKGPYEGTSLR